MAEHGRYLYAVTAPIPDDTVSGIVGIDGAAVATVRHQDLSAVVSDVELQDFGEEGLRSNLEHLDWLERVARAHHHVVQAVSEQAPTAPLRLATICLDDEAVHDRLVQWYEELRQVLSHVTGRQEWSVKVLAPQPAPAPVSETAHIGGAAYLHRKKAAAIAKQTAAESAIDLAEAVHAVLRAEAVDDRRLPPQDPVLSGRQGTMVLNAAYLIPHDASDAFQHLVQTLRDEHPEVVVDCQGPWPPYLFAMLDHDV